MDSLPYLFAFLIFIVLFCIWLYAVLDVLRSDFRASNDKILWIVVVFIGSILGALIYLMLRKRYKKVY